MRRLWFLLAVAVMLAVANADGPGMYDTDACMDLFIVSPSGVMVDGVGTAKVRLYRSYYADTTGHGHAATWGLTLDGVSKWRACNCSTGVYDIYWDSAGTVQLVHDDFPMWFRTVGDTTVTSPEHIGPDVIVAAHITAGAVTPLKLDATGGPVDGYILTYADSSLQFSWLEILDLIGSDLDLHRLNVDSISALDSASIAVTSPVVCDSPLTVGAYTLPVADGAAGNVLKTDGAGVLAWAADATGAGGAAYAESLETADGRFDADDWLNATGDIDTTNVATTEWEVFIQGHQTPPGAFAGFPESLMVYFADTLDAYGFVAADTTGGPLATYTYIAGLGHMVASAFADSFGANDDDLLPKADVRDSIQAVAYYPGGTDVADADVVDALTLSTVSGSVDMGAATSLEIPNADNPTTDAEGEIAWDADDEAIEVYSGDEAESALIPMYQKFQFLISLPDSVAAESDTIPVWDSDALTEPHGIEIDSLWIELSADAAYSLEWLAFSDADPRVLVAVIDTCTTGASDTRAGAPSIDYSAIASGGQIRAVLPSTHVSWLKCGGVYHIKEGD